jgi:hypothetical protein
MKEKVINKAYEEECFINPTPRKSYRATDMLN